MGPVRAASARAGCRASGAVHSPREVKHHAGYFNGIRAREYSTPVPFAPPLALAKAFSRSGCGRIFPLYSRVMRAGLSTGPGVSWRGSRLSGPVFSGPHDCADLVNFHQAVEIEFINHVSAEHFDFRDTFREGTEIELPPGLAFQARLADEFQRLPPGAALEKAMLDYARLRDQARACVGASQIR